MARLTATILLISAQSSAFVVHGAVLTRPEARVHVKMPPMLGKMRGAAKPSLMAASGKAASDTPLKCKLTIAAYLSYALGFALLLVKTLKQHPLIPPSPSSLAWW